MEDRHDIQISETPLSIDACYQHVLHPSCGGVVLFVGTVRDHNMGQQVTHLDFEVYGPMAISELQKIAEELTHSYDVQRVSIHHRTGAVSLKEIAVVIAVSCVHRKEAFVACEHAIDQLKLHVPIWKKEHLTDGSYWVNARP